MITDGLREDCMMIVLFGGREKTALTRTQARTTLSPKSFQTPHSQMKFVVSPIFSQRCGKQLTLHAVALAFLGAIIWCGIIVFDCFISHGGDKSCSRALAVCQHS